MRNRYIQARYMQVRVRTLSAALAALLALAGCGLGTNRVEQDGTAAVQTQTESRNGNSESSTDHEAEVSPGTSEESPESPYKAGKLGDDYILPDARDHVYTEQELGDLTPEELRVARNEIYARHGRKFKSDDLNLYFSGKSWYEASVEPDGFDDGLLNQNERDNLKVIQRMETASQVCVIPRMGVEEFPVIDGSTATLPISQALYRMATGASVQEAEAAVSHQKTTQAWMSLVEGGDKWYREPDLVIAYEPGEEVRKAMEKPGQEILMKPIGRDALVFLSNRSNPVTSLTRRQIVDIYSGALDNWKAVGGGNRKIQAFQRPEDSGSQNMMEKLVMKGTKMAAAPVDRVASEMGELIERVSAYDGTGDALGYSVYYYARNMYQKPELTFMAVDGVKPESTTIRDGSYPFVNDFYAAVRADEPRDSRAYQLFEWLTSEDGQSLINGLGYVGVGDGAKALPAELTETSETFTASIPLPEGKVILASGQMMYGEIGIGVYDSRMNLLHFISHVESPLVDPYLECGWDEVIPAEDSLTGESGGYSVRKNKLVSEDGGEDQEDQYILASSFGDNHPELLQKYGVTRDGVDTRYYSDSLPPVMVITQGNLEHYYDVEGNHMLDFDTEGKPEEEQPYRYVVSVDQNMAYMWIDERNAEGDRYLIYQDGKLVKELRTDERGSISTISQHFYTRWNGSYQYIYNYQDEVCAKFLGGYERED